MKRLTYFIIAFLAFAVCACEKPDLQPVKDEQAIDPDAGKGPASLKFAFRTSSTPGDGVLADGGGFQDLLVFVVRHSDNRIDGKATPSSLGNVTSKEVVISGLAVNTEYDIYVYGNTAGFANIYPTFSTVQALAVGGTFSTSYQDQVSATIASGQAPQIAGNVMPLTGFKRGVSLASTVEQVEVELTRPFAKLTVNVYNKSSFRLDVTALSFTAFNPDRTYIFDHYPENESDYTPAGLQYVEMPEGHSEEIDARSSGTVFEGLLFEGRLYAANGGQYKIDDIGFKFWDSENSRYQVIDVPAYDTIPHYRMEQQITGYNYTYNYSAGDDVTSGTFASTDTFAIHEGNYYLYDNNGSLAVSTNSPWTREAYLWIVTGTVGNSGCVIQNVSTGRRIGYRNNNKNYYFETGARTVSLASGIMINLGTINGGATAYLRRSGTTSVQKSTTNSQNQWTFTKRLRTIATSTPIYEQVQVLDYEEYVQKHQWLGETATVAANGTTFSNAKCYTIKDGTRYLQDNAGTARLVNNPVTLDSTYMWVISGSSTSASIKNLKTGNYIRTATNNSTTVTLNTTSQNLTLSYNNGFRIALGAYSGTNYYLRNNSGTLQRSSSTTYTYFKFTEAAFPVVTTSGEEMHSNNLVICQTQENSQVTDMLRMRRNSHITVNLYVSYLDNPVDDFEYYVLPWTDVSYDIEFK